MNAPLASPINGDALPSIQAAYAERCDARALLVINGNLSLQEAVDELQTYAESSGVVDAIGQDEAQQIMSEAFAMVEAAPDELNEAYEREIMVRAADLVRKWELEEPSRRPIERPAARPVASYRTPAATVAAFMYVASLDNPEDLAAWLADHPRDAKFLLTIWKARPC